jgi:hypothetical protein
VAEDIPEPLKPVMMTISGITIYSAADKRRSGVHQRFIGVSCGLGLNQSVVAVVAFVDHSEAFGVGITKHEKLIVLA